MVIRASSARQINALLTELRSLSSPERDSAVARLTIIGSRAVRPLSEVVQSNEAAATRVAALKAIEAIGDFHGLDSALRAVDDSNSDVAHAAVMAARRFLDGTHGATVLDRLTGIALDASRPESLRVESIRALCALERRTIAPLIRRLRADLNPAIRAAADMQTVEADSEAQDPVTEVTRAGSDGLGDDPVRLRQAILDAAPTASLSALSRIVERAREREVCEPPGLQQAWTAVRGAAHIALARRGSRLATYDLRESIERAKTPLPADFVAALTKVGDRMCLEAIAAAYARSGDTTRRTHQVWRRQLTDSFRAIAEREGVTRRHAVIKKIEKRWKNLAELWPV